ncbi:hypothetical protein F5X99DRAFT_264465 [Biscogniauxia marginata]|nr:hypothetical protein F5X99DRAFT_264465 [Biscogniauxia marginata]
MARKKPKTSLRSNAGPSSPPPSASAPSLAPKPNSRPLSNFYVLLFAAAAGLFMWLMRIESALEDVPVRFLPQVEAARLDDGTPLVARYTGFAPLDNLLRVLVVAFIAGPTGSDPSVRLQQVHFLGNLFGALCVWNVEACRRRNAWRLISFTAILALFYQTIGSAIIVPLYYASHIYISSSPTYYASGRSVPLPRARALLLSSVVGYLVPTVAMYLPWGSVRTTQYLTALWQPSPAFINVLLFVGSSLLSLSPSPTASSQKQARNADVKHLKRAYLFAFVVSALSHAGVIYLCLFPSRFPLLTSLSHAGTPSLRSVFLPSRQTRKATTAAGLHYIFQVDEWGLFVPSLLWCWVAVGDVLRLLPRRGGSSSSSRAVIQLGTAAGAIFGLAAVFGPGAAMAAVWSWREDKLVVIEEDAAKRASRKDT